MRFKVFVYKSEFKLASLLIDMIGNDHDNFESE